MKNLGIVVSRFEEVVIGVLLLIASVILFSNVVARYVFNESFSWATEVVRYQIIWMVFIGGSVAARRGMHIGVDIIVKFSGPRIRQAVLLIVYTIAIAFCVYVAYFGIELVMKTRSWGQVSPAAQIPMWLMQLAIPVGSILMGIRFLQHLINTLIGKSEHAHLESIG
jgi:C4-dicarboxylate transporter DctQ subunit